MAMIAVRYALRIKRNVGSLTQRGMLTSKSSSEKQYSTEEVEVFRRRIRQHQTAAPKPSAAEEVRTLLVKSNGYATLSTNSVQYAGVPFGSYVGFSYDRKGHLFTVISTLASHTHDLVRDGKCSLLVTDGSNNGAETGRVTIAGSMSRVVDPTIRQELRSLYLSKHNNAYWVDFGYDPVVVAFLSTHRCCG